MTLAAWADLSQIVGAIAVVLSLGYLALQIRQNTRQMRRGESNTAMLQGSAVRHAIIENRDVAELLSRGVAGAALDAADALRFNALLNEIAFMTFQTWDRVRVGLAQRDDLVRMLSVIAPMMTSQRGLEWWRRSRTAFLPDFVTDLERIVPGLAATP